MTRKALLGAAFALVLATACGTTVPAGQAVDAGTGLDDSTPGSALTTGVDPGSPSTGPVSAPVAAGPVGSAGPAGATQPEAAPERGGVTLPRRGTSGRGFTPTKVYVGVNSWQDVGTVSGLVGGETINTGDQQAYARAVIAAINKSGGIAGRQVEAVFYDFQTGRAAEGGAVVTQEACELWTRDRPVFAVLYGSGMFLDDAQMAACLTAAGVPMVFMNYTGMSSWFDKYPLVWAPMSARDTRVLPAVIRRAKAQGYFGGWDTTQGAPGAAPVKIGIQTGAGDFAPETTKLLTAAARAEGYQVVATAEIDGVQDGAAANAAVLSFRSKGVTHVMQDSQCIGGTVPFMQSAESQDYRPRYLMHTGNCPRLLLGFTPAAQWRGAIGAGIQPGLDVDWAHDPGDPSPSRPGCLKTMQDAGENPRLSRDAYAFMVWYCDGFQFLRAAIVGGGDVLSAQAFLRGAQGIRQMPPSATFVTSFLQRRDGAAALRDVVFDADCQCPVYVGKNRPF